uniref:Ig-like domain-containing protein n=1 Tax=Anopheles christyi TaxID=43041 RepID=A0A182KB91_9DIPT
TFSFLPTPSFAELRARILGPSDIFIKSGSEITMVCVIQQGPHELGTVFWYKGNTLVEPVAQENDIHSGDRGRITIETDWTDALTSRLKIKRAVQGDTGNYTCVPTMARSASVYAHVISGEHPAAMQHNAAPNTIGHRMVQRSMCILLLLHLATLLYLLSDRCCSRRSVGPRNILQRPVASHRSARSIAPLDRCEARVFPTDPS